MTQSTARLILASQSPRRAALLHQIGVDFEAVPSTTPEPPPAPGEIPREYALRTATHKASEVWEKVGDPGAWVLAADTIVVIDGSILGKPTSPTHAEALLARLSDRQHQVITGYTIITKEERWANATTTDVWFRPLTKPQIQAYIDTKEPLDKAGAYGIQGRAAVFVRRLEGCYFNVVGLPLSDLMHDLAALGFSAAPRHPHSPGATV